MLRDPAGDVAVGVLDHRGDAAGRVASGGGGVFVFPGDPDHARGDDVFVDQVRVGFYGGAVGRAGGGLRGVVRRGAGVHRVLDALRASAQLRALRVLPNRACGRGAGGPLGRYSPLRGTEHERIAAFEYADGIVGVVRVESGVS